MANKYRQFILKHDLIFISILFILSFSFYTHYVAYNVSGDAVSQYYPAQKIISEDNLNMWNPLNNDYGTYYFKLPFTDEVIYNWNRSYPMQTLGTILLNAFVIGIFGNNAFFYVNPFFASVCIIFVYLIVNELVTNRIIATISSLILFSMPIFMFWAIIPQNIMPATAFLVMSVYFIIKYKNTNKKIYLILSSIFCAYTVFTRLVHVLFVPAYLIYFFDTNKKYKFDIISILQFFIPLIIIFFLITLLKIKYFADPFFIGYLHTDYHPMVNGSNLIVITTDTYLLSGMSINAIVNSIKLFIIGSMKIFHPLILASLLGFILINKNNKNMVMYSLYFIWILLISLLYYGNLEETLWKPTDARYEYSLSLVFFRYLLPVYVLSIAMLAYVLDKLLKTMRTRRISLLFLFMSLTLIMSYVSIPINYTGGASLTWYEEINSKTIDYSTTLPKYIENNSVILYATRNPLSYTYPYTMNYNWFYYDGIPPDYRYKHTEEVIDKLLMDNRTVYFVQFESPYDELSKDMYTYLNENFQLKYVENTYFPRMKSRFYLIGIPINDK